MATLEEIQQLRELAALQAAQLEAVAQELNAQRTATAQTEVRAGLIFVGEHDGQERWATWSFKMKAYCAAMAPRLGELMGTASTQDVEIRQDAMTPSDAARSTNLYFILSLSTVAEALDIVQNSPWEQWTGGAASHGGSLGTESTIQVPRNAASDLVSKMGHSWIRRDTVVTTAWEKQVQDYEQQSDDKISDAIKLRVVLHHLPDTSLREHLLLNSRA